MDNFSFTLAKILRRIKPMSSVSRKYNVYRHKKIMGKLQPFFDRALMNAKNTQNSIPQKKKVIWLFWWQGIEEMPPLVLKCYKSILKYRGSYQVIVITKDNIHEYAALPSYIYDKVAQQEITLTHLSDILRFNLLSQYGGLWMDSTLFVTGSLDQIRIDQLFTCSGYDSNNMFNVSAGRWTGFLIGGPSNLEIFIFMNEFFLNYWETNDSLLDYFLIDYALNFAWLNNLSSLQNISYANQNVDPQMFKLEDLLNETFSKSVASRLLNDTFIFKLSNRQPVNLNDKQNFYNHLESLQVEGY